ncbi:MAG: anthranilate synthase component I family protein [Phenylobacterium sp.]
MRDVEILSAPWREPAEVLAACASEPHALAFFSDGSPGRGRWSYVMRRPLSVLELAADDPADPFQAMRAALAPAARNAPGGPPFQGGLAGLMSYELGYRVEPVGHRGCPDWPLLVCGLYPSLLAFDHQAREVLAIGRGAGVLEARGRAREALELLDAPAPPARPGRVAEDFTVLTPGEVYEEAVADVVARIAAGEIFQANIARAWGGRLRDGMTPLDLLRALAASSPAPFAAYYRLPGKAVVSNSPERFVAVSDDGGLKVETRPIKGTRPRGRTPAADDAMRQELVACAKDRAENLMIVDLMRNDLSRVCRTGEVAVPELFKVESFANVHHLVSTVTGRLVDGLSSVDLFEAAFPPGSITGAPKVQAMKVIAGFEPPRGPYCGSMFWAGLDGGCDSSVLIRTVALSEDAGGWRFEARAGAGIVADSDPHSERLETEAKIDAIRRALTGEAA